MKFFKNLFNKQVSQPVGVTETVVRVLLAEMNARFDRLAGRWCVHCGQNGSHHSDRHNDFAQAVLSQSV